MIKRIRLDQGLTQEQLAWKTKFHPTYIGRVERGERNLSLKNAETFSKAFGIHIKELFNLID
ncbi:MAG: helix-turn-helix transcriptional regulator [Cyclobacteriaceae bacterium]